MENAILFERWNKNMNGCHRNSVYFLIGPDLARVWHNLAWLVRQSLFKEPFWIAN